MIYNLGSINLDMVYRLRDLPQAGETLSAMSFDRFLGGKGVNQSVAIAASGEPVCHIGAVGPDGDWVLSEMDRFGVGTGSVARIEEATGHAIVAVDDAAENQIIIFGGANQAIPFEWAEERLGDLEEGDFVLFQNETNLTPEVAKLVSDRGAKLVLSAAPFDAEHVTTLRPYIHVLAVNEGEADALSSAFGERPQDMGFPMLVVTRGGEGTTVYSDGQVFEQPAFAVDPIDTTGAGDTFIGSFIARLSAGNTLDRALNYAAAAAALQVTKPGAAEAIPNRDAVLDFLKERS